MELPSEWEWYWKLLAVVLLIAVMSFWGYALNEIVRSLPLVILFAVGFTGLGLLFGFFLGERVGKRDAYRQITGPDKTPASQGYLRDRRFRE